MSSFKIKIIAIVSMTIDHIEQILFSYNVYNSLFTNGSATIHYYVSMGMHCIGRLAMPVFAFMIAEGCRKTHDIKQFIFRLLVFAVISEVVFDLAFDALNSLSTLNLRESGKLTFLSFSQQNVMFTLALGCIAIYIFQSLKDKNYSTVLAVVATIPIVLIGGIARTDYSIYGVALVISAYVFKGRKGQLITMFIILTLLYLGYASWNGYTFGWLQKGSISYLMPWIFACLSLIMLNFYNGKRGHTVKYFFTPTIRPIY